MRQLRPKILARQQRSKFIWLSPAGIPTIVPVCTAQGGGGSFKDSELWRLVAVNHASQSKCIDGSKSGWRKRSVVAAVFVVAM